MSIETISNLKTENLCFQYTIFKKCLFFSSFESFTFGEYLFPKSGVPNLWPQTGTCQIGSSTRLEIKCTINVMHLNHPKPSLLSQVLKNCLPQNWPLVPKSLGTAAYADIPYVDLFFTEDHEKAQLLISPLIFIRKNKYWETLKPHKHS